MTSAMAHANGGNGVTWRHDAFVSYASEDRARAGAIVDALQLHGYRVWWDRELRANEEFSPAIEAELDGSASVVVLWSKHSVQKRFVREEAVRGHSRLVPVLLDDVQAPLGFGQTSAVDLRRWRADELALELKPLIASVGRLANRPPDPVPFSWWRIARSVYLDLKTRMVLGAMLLSVAAIWLLSGPDRWRQADLQWLAAGALLVTSAWVSSRAARLARSRTWQWAAPTALVVAGLALGWQAWRYYEPPRFHEERTGIAVARFADDRLRPKAQEGWLGYLRQERAGLRTSAALKPWVERVDIRLLQRLIGDDDEARRLAARMHALVVLWGRPGGSAGMTFADLPGFWPGADLALSLPTGIDLGVDPLEAVSGPVVRFASAYGAFVQTQFDVAQPLLEELASELQIERSGKLTATASLLATTHLLLGNTRFHEGCRAGEIDACVAALEHYQTAREVFDPKQRAGNLFVEATNNLAVTEARLVALANRQARDAGDRGPLPGMFDAAASTLEDAASACAALSPAPPLACTFVAYNRAVAASTARRHAQALEILMSACTDDEWRRLAIDSRSSLPARCHQQRAYAAAKLGESAESPTDAARWFGEAARHAEKADAVLPPQGAADVRLKLTITQGRIEVGLGQYPRAAERLAPFVVAAPDAAPRLSEDVAREHPNLDGPEIAALWAVARHCSGATTSPLPTAMLPEALGAAEAEYLNKRSRHCKPGKEE